MLMGPAFAGGEKGRKKKMQKEKDGGAEGETDGEEVRAAGTREWMCSHYTLCSFNFFKEDPTPRHLEHPRRSLQFLHPLALASGLIRRRQYNVFFFLPAPPNGTADSYLK